MLSLGVCCWYGRAAVGLLPSVTRHVSFFALLPRQQGRDHEGDQIYLPMHVAGWSIEFSNMKERRPEPVLAENRPFHAVGNDAKRALAGYRGGWLERSEIESPGWYLVCV